MMIWLKYKSKNLIYSVDSLESEDNFGVGSVKSPPVGRDVGSVKKSGPIKTTVMTVIRVDL